MKTAYDFEENDRLWLDAPRRPPPLCDGAEPESEDEDLTFDYPGPDEEDDIENDLEDLESDEEDDFEYDLEDLESIVFEE